MSRLFSWSQEGELNFESMSLRKEVMVSEAGWESSFSGEAVPMEDKGQNLKDL